MTEPRLDAPRAPLDARVLDVRFSAYEGARGSVGRSVVVLARWSLLRALGRRRGWGAKALPFSLLALAFLPAVAVLGVRAILSSRFDTDELPVDLLPYGDYIGLIGIVIVAWTAFVTPSLICPDLRHRVTSLYYATAVSPRQYLAGKLLASLAAMFAITFLPVAMLFIGTMLFAQSPVDYVRDNADVLPRLLGASLIATVYFAVLGLAISSLTGRQAYAVGGFVGLALASGVLSGVVTEITGGGSGGIGPALSILGIPTILGERLFADSEFSVPAFAAMWIAVVAASLAVLLIRFRRAS